jgi:hypothetical protein
MRGIIVASSRYFYRSSEKGVLVLSVVAGPLEALLDLCSLPSVLFSSCPISLL